MLKHWLAIQYNQQGIYGDDTPHWALGTLEEADEFHWFGGYSHFSYPPKGLIIIKDYGIVHDMDEERIEQINNDYRMICPLLPFDLSRALVHDVDGYLAPNGDIYRCEWLGHTRLAKDLIYQFKIEPDLTAKVNHDQEGLIKAGWILLMHGVVPYDNPPTDAQLKTLKQLMELNTRFHYYQEGIIRYLKHVAKLKGVDFDGLLSTYVS